MTQRTNILLVGGVLALALFGAARAGPLEDALAAYQRGDYATAVQIWRPLPEQGDAFSQSPNDKAYANDAKRFLRERLKPRAAIVRKPIIIIAQVCGSGVASAVTVPSIARWIGEPPLVPENSAKYAPLLRMSGVTVAPCPPMKLVRPALSIREPPGTCGGNTPVEVQSFSEIKPPMILRFPKALSVTENVTVSEVGNMNS